jgi:hypothetical protein
MDQSWVEKKAVPWVFEKVSLKVALTAVLMAVYSVVYSVVLMVAARAAVMVDQWDQM